VVIFCANYWTYYSKYRVQNGRYV